MVFKPKALQGALVLGEKPTITLHKTLMPGVSREKMSNAESAYVDVKNRTAFFFSMKRTERYIFKRSQSVVKKYQVQCLVHVRLSQRDIKAAEIGTVLKVVPPSSGGLVLNGWHVFGGRGSFIF